jgi:hypothetical protein
MRKKRVRRETTDGASNATKRDSKANRKKSARTDVLLLEFTSQVALQDEQDQQSISFFFREQGVEGSPLRRWSFQCHHRQLHSVI